MRFAFPGDHTFKIEAVSGPLRDLDGDPAFGIIDRDRQVIELDTSAPASERLRTAAHEIVHGWRWFAPPPPVQDEEAFCDWAALLMVSFATQIERQGGTLALLALEFDNLIRFDVAALTRTLRGLGVDRMTACGACEQRIAVGSVAVSKPKRHPISGRAIVDMAFACPTCDRVTHWAEFCGQAGRPTGECAIEPEYLDPDKAAEFVAAHPDKVTYQSAS